MNVLVVGVVLVKGESGSALLVDCFVKNKAVELFAWMNMFYFDGFLVHKS